MINFDHAQKNAGLSDRPVGKKDNAVNKREIKTGGLDVWDDLVGGFYDSVLEPDLFLPALQRFDEWLGSSVCHLFGWDAVANTMRFSLMTLPDLMPAGNAYNDYYGKIDPRRELVSSMQVGKTFACSDFFDNSFVARNEFYQDLLIPWGMRYVIGGTIYREGPLSVMFAFNHQVGQPQFSKEQIAATDRMLKHIERTLRFISKGETLRAGLLAGDVGLEAFDQGVVVIDRLDFVVFANKRAQATLDERLVLKLAGRKLNSDPFGGGPLPTLLAKVRASRQPDSVTLHVSGFAVDGSDRVHLTVIPLPPGSRRSSAFAASPEFSMQHNAPAASAPAASGFGFFDSADLIIIISKSARLAAVSAFQLARLFGLSQAESRLAHALASGLSLDEYALQTAVSTTTVRNQLRAVLDKTGYRRQQDLVRGLSGLPSVKPQIC